MIVNKFSSFSTARLLLIECYIQKNMNDTILNKLLAKAKTSTSKSNSSSSPLISLTSQEIQLPDNLPLASEDVLEPRKKIKKLNNSFANDGNCCKFERIEKKNLDINLTRLRLKPVSSRHSSETFSIQEGEVYDKSEHNCELDRYKVENLNTDQRKIWDYINKNKTDIVMIQAGPGCGKSFTLKTIAYNKKDTKFDTIIYKLDLLASFKLNSRRFTVAKFVMKMLNMKFFQYKAFDKLLSSKITAYEFMLVIISMLKRANLPNMQDGIVFLDEYTIVSKPILLIILMLFEYHKIGAIICGDRDQLQNIYNSKHAPLSSFKLAASFAKQQFQLHINERCSDVAYNKIIDYISQFSSSLKLDGYAYAMVSAIFLKQLIEPPDYHQLHLAGTHQELADLIHMLVCQNKYPTDFYTIDQSRLRDKDNIVQSKPALQPTKALIDYSARIANNEPPKVDKFLPYIPLVIGARYYVLKHSEYSQGILKEINPDNTLEMEMDNGSTIIVGRNTNDAVIFDQHREFLLNGELGKIFAYPIYPANYMSIHKCQGCTITANLDLMLANTQYQGLYVALSRVTNPAQIARVTIPDQISHIISTIINFPQHADNIPITVEDLKTGMINYVFYNVNRDMTPFVPLISEFILSTDVTLKRSLRENIISMAKNYPQTILQPVDSVKDETSNLLTMSLIIKYRDVFLALSCLDEIDRNVWVHEYLLVNPEMSCLLPKDFIPNSKNISQFQIKELNELIRMADLNESYSLEMSTLEYIEQKSKPVIRMNEKDRIKHNKFVVKAKDEYMFYENTEFCAKVYNKLINEGSTTESWLIDELNYMISNFRQDITVEPQKVNVENDDGRGVRSSISNHDDIRNRLFKLQAKRQRIV